MNKTFIAIYFFISTISTVYAGSTPPPRSPPSIEELQNRKEMQILKDKTELEKLRLNNEHRAEMQQSKQLHERQVIKINKKAEREKIILIYVLSIIAFIIVASFVLFLYIRSRNIRLQMQENRIKKEILVEALKSGYVSQERKRQLMELSKSKKRLPKLINKKDPKF